MLVTQSFNDINFVVQTDFDQAIEKLFCLRGICGEFKCHINLERIR